MKCPKCGYTNAHTTWCENETLRQQLAEEKKVALYHEAEAAKYATEVERLKAGMPPVGWRLQPFCEFDAYQTAIQTAHSEGVEFAARAVERLARESVTAFSYPAMVAEFIRKSAKEVKP